MQARLEARRLTKSRPVPAIRDVSFTLEPGAIQGCWGRTARQVDDRRC